MSAVLPWAAASLTVALAVVLGRWRSRRARRRSSPLNRLSGGGAVVDTPRPVRQLSGPPHPAVVGCAVATVGLLGAGPVAAVAGGVYGALAANAWRDYRRGRLQRVRRLRALDALSSLAAELRAGLPPSAVGDRAGADGPPERCEQLAHQAVRLAESTGAPLADLVERIEADARAGERARLNAEVETSASQATSWLLAGLPLGGIALGYGMGADPLQVLLHTPWGAACALAALLFQLVGVAWSRRLTRTAKPGPLPPTPPSRNASRQRWRLAIGGLLTAAVVALQVGGLGGLPVGALAGATAVLVLRRLPPADLQRWRDRAAEDLPLMADLLAAALRAGAPMDRAVAAVAVVIGGPLGHCLDRVARALRLGADAAEAWTHLDGVPGAERLATAAIRGSSSGAALAGAFRQLADDLRSDRRARAEAAARRTGVLTVLPLGLCFLPAFLLAGLMPVVIAVIGSVGLPS